MSNIMAGNMYYHIPSHHLHHTINFKDIEKSITYDAYIYVPHQKIFSKINHYTYLLNAFFEWEHQHQKA